MCKPAALYPSRLRLQVPQHEYRVVGDAGSEKVEIDVHLRGESSSKIQRGHSSSVHVGLHYDQRLPRSAAADMTDKLLIALQLSCC
jgi:hypothetical protein